MKNWTIRKRIIVTLAIVVTLSAAMGVAALYSMRIVGEHADELARDKVPALAKSADVLKNFSAAHLELIRSVLSTNADEKQKIAARLSEIGQANTALLKELEGYCEDPQEKVLAGKLDQARQAYLKVRGPILELSAAGKNQEALAELMGAGRAAHNAYEVIATEFSNYETKGGVEASGIIQKTVRASTKVLGLGVTIEVLLSIGLGLLVVIGLNRVLTAVSSSLGEGADQVASAAGQVSSASQSLAEGASEQAASLEETSSSLEEMSSMTKRNADNAQKANDLAKQARAAADRGAQDMQDMSTAMEGIKNSSNDIAKIIKTIDEIAFQTNILALNAAVEAARAGEAGMGFAVVADEVRNLAQRCAQSAKETSEKIEGAITRTTQGVEISSKVSNGLQDIVSKVRQVDELVAEVASACNEQNQGISQVNTAVSQMDKVTQSNAASAEESASAAEELSAQAETMRGSVNELRTLVDGSRATSTKTQLGKGTKEQALPLPAPSRAATLTNVAQKRQKTSRTITNVQPELAETESGNRLTAAAFQDM